MLVFLVSVLGAVPAMPVTSIVNGATPVVQLTETTWPKIESVQPAGTEPTDSVTALAAIFCAMMLTVELPVTVASVVIAGAVSEKS